MFVIPFFQNRQTANYSFPKEVVIPPNKMGLCHYSDKRISVILISYSVILLHLPKILGFDDNKSIQMGTFSSLFLPRNHSCSIYFWNTSFMLYDVKEMGIIAKD